MKWWFLSAAVIIGALTVPASAQKPGPPASASFSVDACVNRDTLQVTASATWSHAGVDSIQFRALSNGALLGERTVSVGGTKGSSIEVTWLPAGSTRTAITDHVEVDFNDPKGRWTLTGAVVDFGGCS